MACEEPRIVFIPKHLGLEFAIPPAPEKWYLNGRFDGCYESEMVVGILFSESSRRATDNPSTATKDIWLIGPLAISMGIIVDFSSQFPT